MRRVASGEGKVNVRKPQIAAGMPSRRLDLLGVLAAKKPLYAGDARVKISSCPIDLPAQWRTIYETLHRPPLGASLAIFAFYGMNQFDRTDEVSRYDDLLREIALADLPLKAQRELHKKMGSQLKPAFPFIPVSLSSDTEDWQFRCSAKVQSKFYGRAQGLGMSASHLLVPLIAKGMSTQACVHPEFKSAACNDFDLLVVQTGEREPDLRDLFDYYSSRRRK